MSARNRNRRKRSISRRDQPRSDLSNDQTNHRDSVPSDAAVREGGRGLISLVQASESSDSIGLDAFRKNVSDWLPG